MKFLFDEEECLAINTSYIIAAKLKNNRNDGAFKNRDEYPTVVDVHVFGRDKPFTVYLTRAKEMELTRLLQNKEDVE